MITARDIVKTLPLLTVSELQAIEQIAFSLRMDAMRAVQESLKTALEEK